MGFNKTYDYNDVPTIRRFNECEKFFKVLCGPFGSGKSSGCVAEIVDRGIRQAPNHEGIRKTRWAVVRNCYDDQTEILTEKRGFQLFKDVLPDDRVATLQGENNDEIVYKLPDGVAVHDYSGEMVGYKGESVDFLVTPEHKMWVSKHRTRKIIWGNYEIKEAKDIYMSNSYRVRRDAIWSSGHTKYTTDMFEFFGFYLAEGSYCKKNKSLIISQNNGNYVIPLFERCGIKKYSISIGRQFKIQPDDNNYDGLIKLLSPLGRSWEKYIPQVLKDAPPEHLRALIRGFTIGDGNVYKGTTRLYTSSKQLANDLQEIAIKAGYVSNLASRNRVGNKLSICDVETKCNHKEYTITLLTPKKYRPRLKRNRVRDGWYKIDYNGKVYCVELPEIPVCVRRNGVYFWCLRTFPQLESTTMKTVFDWVPHDTYGDSLGFGTLNVSKHNYTIDKIALDDGTKVNIEIMFRALDKPDHVRNLLSLELTGAWFNEMREIPWAIVEAMEGRVRRYPSVLDGGFTWSGVIGDTNPPDTDSMIYKLFEERVPKDIELASKYELFRQPSGRSDQAENMRWLHEDYYKTLAIGKDPEYIKVYIDGEYGYIRDGKPVYGNYLDTLHLSSEPLEGIKGIPLILGFDFGMTGACVICQLLPNGKFNILKELFEEDIGLRRFLNDVVKPYLLSKYRGFEIISTGDPAGIRRQDTDERTAYDELRLQGFPATPARSNSFLARFNAVDVFLTKLVGGKAAFQLDPSCDILRKGFLGEYKLKKYRGYGDDKFSETPVKNNFSHLQDALQYSAMVADSGFIAAKGYMGNRYATPKVNKRSMSGWI